MSAAGRVKRRLERLLQEWCTVYGADLPCLRPEALAAPPPSAPEALAALAVEIEACRACPLGASRKRAVPGEGPPGAPLLVVGGAPSLEEERHGAPFQGEEGGLLTRMLELGVGIPRGAAFLTTAVKCRPPGGRDPEGAETRACARFLAAQVEFARPRAILALGRVAAAALLGTQAPLPVLRGREHKFAGLPLVVTWDLAYLVRYPAAKAESWQDLKLAMKLADLPLPTQTGKKDDSSR